MTIETKSTPDCGAMENPCLTNYNDKFVIMTNCRPSGTNSVKEWVQLYDIERDAWSALPSRKAETITD